MEEGGILCLALPDPQGLPLDIQGLPLDIQAWISKGSPCWRAAPGLDIQGQPLDIQG